MNRKDLTWEQVKSSLNFTPEEIAEIKLEEELIEAEISARKKSKLSQKELGEKAGIKQPTIARIESRARSPQVTTLIRMLYPMGYTLRVVPIENKVKQKSNK